MKTDCFKLRMRLPTLVFSFAAVLLLMIPSLKPNASAGTPQIRVMVWRILQGMSIETIRLEYRAEGTFMLSVRLVSPYGQTEDYESSDIDDAVVLRHLGIMKMDEKGIFDGFVPLRRREE